MRSGPKPMIDTELFRPRTEDEVWELTRALVERTGISAGRAHTAAVLLATVPSTGLTRAQSVRLAEVRPLLAQLGEPPWGGVSVGEATHAIGGQRGPQSLAA